MKSKSDLDAPAMRGENLSRQFPSMLLEHLP